jgi:DNA-binding XRE family transcriptional regulator
LSDVLKRFEARYARVLAPRIVLPMDIDILLYGEFVGVYEYGVLPRSDLIDRPYVMMPLAMLAPEGVHPITGKTYKTTWLEFERDMSAEGKPVLVVSDGLTLQQREKNAGADDFVMAQTLKSLRLRQGLTQRKLAEKARVTHSSISVIEKNQASPGVNTLGKILSALSTSLPEFFAEIERGGAEVKPEKRVLEF